MQQSLNESQKAQLAKALLEGREYKHPNVRILVNQAMANKQLYTDALQAQRAAPITNRSTRKLIENYERQHGAIVEVIQTADDSEIKVAGMANGSKHILMDKGALQGPSDHTSAVFLHEVTHNTSVRHIEKGRVNKVTLGRNMDFYSKNGFDKVNPAYKSWFRSDEVEARIKEMAFLKSRGPEASALLKQSIVESKKFVSTQTELVQQALGNEAKFQIGFTPYDKKKTQQMLHIQLDNSNDIYIPLEGKELRPEELKTYAHQILQERLKILRRFQTRIERYEQSP